MADFLTVSEAAARLKVSERTVRRRCESGKLKAELVTTDTGMAWQIEADSCGQGADTAANSAAIGADTPKTENRTQEYSRGAAKVSEAAGGAAIGADVVRSLGRLEGYAARDLETTIAQAVSSAVEKAVAPLAEEIRELRAQIEKQSREDAPHAPKTAPDDQTATAVKQSAQRVGRGRKMTSWQRIAARVLGLR